jgi:hypothetical protein
MKAQWINKKRAHERGRCSAAGETEREVRIVRRKDE